MAGDDDLRINTLHRFAKRSPRLVLHEYSHCEVPAGCGGVVLRWLDPARGAPATVRVVASGVEASCWLDGEPLASGLTLLREGGRLLAVHLRRTEPGPRPFTVGVHHDEEHDHETDLIGAGARRCCTRTPPAGGAAWTAVDFDDARWAEAPRATPAQLAAADSWLTYNFDRAREAGRPVLVLDADELWLRIAFTAPGAP